VPHESESNFPFCNFISAHTLGHNLSQGACPALNAPADRENYTSALLADSLAIHGGAFPMRTSLLIDAGRSGDCPAIDQRGATRVGICDLGAAECRAAAYNIYQLQFDRSLPKEAAVKINDAWRQR
jgi:hypothetical protein